VAVEAVCEAGLDSDALDVLEELLLDALDLLEELLLLELLPPTLSTPMCNLQRAYLVCALVHMSYRPTSITVAYRFAG
jgi:hypothetical protein